LYDLEHNSPEITSRAKNIVSKVLRSQLETCWELNVSYDCLNFESDIVHSGLLSDILDYLVRENVLVHETSGKNAGCLVFKDPSIEDKVIVRSNKTATYIAKDIPYAAWKLGILQNQFNFKEFPNASKNKKILYFSTLDGESFSTTSRFSGSKVITVIDSRQSLLQNIIKKISFELLFLPIH